jgi:ribonuclease E
MAKKMLIDATHAEETRVVVVDGNKVEEFDFESENKRQLAGNIYLAKVTRVEPSLQAAFVDYGGNRHGFLAFSEIHPDYYQIPVADRKALMEEEAELARAAAEEEEKPKSRSRSRTRKRTTAKPVEDAAPATDRSAREPSGMETIDLDGDDLEVGAPGEGLSPMETVHEAPVAEPLAEQEDPATPMKEIEAVVPQTDAAVAAAPAAAVAEQAAPENAAPEAEAPYEAASPETHSPETSAPEAVEPQAAETPAPKDETAALPPLETPADPAPEQDRDVAESSEEPPEDTEPTTPPRPIAEGSRDDASVVTRDAEAALDDDEDDDDHHDDDDEDDDDGDDAASRDSSIESVADDDTHEDIRPVRKARPRRYKIQEVIKVRQIMLVQVVKEERGNKGAALTTYLSLAGRYCVLMPNTARGGGISRKITNAADRSKLKEIANSIDVPKGAGLIVRTAGAKRTKTEIKRDYEYLQRLWEQIRELTLKSIAPAKIYEEGDLIKRSIRDLYSREIDEVLVEGERGYRVAKDFMKMIMPSHAKNVQHYHDQMPLFARFQVESYLGGMFNPTVQLKSGGYIVIGVTEALVAIDVNSGRATKEASIEDTATKTNLEAAEEVARQLRLRDLAGLIVIDFIDMDERKNNAAVEKRLKDKLKTDRARIQVGRISGFGLLEMSRQRLRPGMIEATTQPCTVCHGSGLIRSDDNLALQVLRQIEEEGVRRRSREVLVKCPVGIANYLMNQKREHVAQIEARYGLSVRIEGEPHLVSPDFTLEKFKTATRVVPEVSAHVVSVNNSLMDQVDLDAETDEDEVEEETVVEAVEAAPAPASPPEPQPELGEDGKPKKKRRRRRRSRSKSKDNGDGSSSFDEAGSSDDDETDSSEAVASAVASTSAAAAEAETETPEVAVEETAKKPRTRSRTRKPRSPKPTADTDIPQEAATPQVAEAQAGDAAAPADAEPSDAPTTPATPVPKTLGAAETPEETETPAPATEVSETTGDEGAAEPADKARPTRTRRKATEVIAAVVGVPDDAVAADPSANTPEPQPQPQASEPDQHPQASATVDETAVLADAEEDPSVAEAPVEAPVPVPAEAEDTTAEPTAQDDDKPKRRGWWSLGS